MLQEEVWGKVDYLPHGYLQLVVEEHLLEVLLLVCLPDSRVQTELPSEWEWASQVYHLLSAFGFVTFGVAPQVHF